eukprot:CAMPEP_0114315290 /NCGR_PEP_ID=MMETSP0059-20121206/22389_1 /TAXON_ID=36894 /ORGANISM="Pyramimonas parkeae, Strain CCMP726" /LENGTH=142 /DNA_ID=CAMNT_0001440741 /DNA_START=655 /DNA_END=1081 /DNA_ORIENTATION=-
MRLLTCGGFTDGGGSGAHRGGRWRPAPPRPPRPTLEGIYCTPPAPPSRPSLPTSSHYRSPAWLVPAKQAVKACADLHDEQAAVHILRHLARGAGAEGFQAAAAAAHPSGGRSTEHLVGRVIAADSRAAVATMVSSEEPKAPW